MKQHPARRSSWFWLAGLAAAGAQTIPPTAPTLPPAPATVVAAPVKAVALTHRARVAFAGETLEVKADNSSLNQILRDIGHATGMKITGGVPEERVYGTYGPAETSTVLTTLLGGTGSNMLLIVDQNNRPTELVLTPRQGGPTPPSPNASRNDSDRDDENPDTPPQLSQHIQPPPAAPPLPPPPTATVQAEPVGPTLAPESPASNATADQSPNGVKTPQQVYEQLLKLQQQKPKTPGVSPP